MRASLAVVLSLTLLSALLPARAEIYRWVDDKNVVHFTDKPPTKDAKPVELPQLQTYNPAAVTPAAAEGAGSGKAAAEAERATRQKPQAIRIASPAPDETFREVDSKISVAVEASLGPGEGLIYYVDGQAQNKAGTPSTGWLIEGLERGEHTISAALVGADGREVSRTPPVTIHLKQPIVRR
ncbi:MAG TPA: DUF4124 domain-containing protein [Nevskia sp.]|nr:DUF4124 domain-containing protein [Nevskia sp.]